VKSKSLEDYDGLALSIGVGEWPLIQQATLSIWKTQAEMIDYAYKMKTQRGSSSYQKTQMVQRRAVLQIYSIIFVGQWNGKMLKIF
jgi:hypothetical protein